MYQKTVLDNGLRVITATMPHIHSASICIFIGVGSRYESKQKAGISHFIEHMMFRGTEKRPTAREISEAIEGLGGTLNAGTDKEMTVYWCKVTQSHFLKALDALADMLLHSKFDFQDVEKERQVIMEEISMYHDSPQQTVSLLIDELLWPAHPLGRDTAGSKHSITNITPNDMLSYIQAHYLPTDTVVSVAANIGHQEVVTAVSQVMGSWSRRKRRPGYAAYREQPVERLRIETRDIEQAHLCLALPGLSLFHPKRFTLDLLNVILGEGMSSRLFSEIRDRLGLAYSISSSVEHFLDSGSITVYAGVEPKNLPAAIRAILEQLSRLKEPISESELTKAKELSTGQLLLRMENSRSVAGWIGSQEILKGHILSVDQVLSIVSAITADDIRQLAEELMLDSQLRLAVVGPASSYYEPLEELLKL